MTPEEIAALRRMASTSGLVSLTGKELATLLAAYIHHEAEAKALREAAGAFLDELPFHEPACPYCPGRVMATKIEALKPPYAGVRFSCDAHAAEGARDMKGAAAWRTLRALLGRMP